MRLKRSLYILIAASMLISLLAGCGNKQNEGKQGEAGAKLPPVKLTAYMVGEEGTDNGQIISELNKLLTRDINATIEVKTIPTAEVPNKYPLIFASGESFDLVFSAGWAMYKQQAAKGGYLELKDDLLNKYMPKSMAQLPKEAWKPVLVDGKKYLIPRTDYKFDPLVIGIRGDLREKYGLPPIKSIDDYEKYLDTIAKNEKGIIPYGDNNANTCWMLATIMLNQPNSWRVLVSGGSDLIHYNLNDKTGDQLFVREAQPEYLAWTKKMVDWRKKGYWSNSALAAKGPPTEQFQAGKGASFIGSTTAALGAYNDLNKKHPEWKVEVYDASFGSKVNYNIPIAGISISATSKNVERSLMALELFRTNREYYDLTEYGLKGKNYDLTADGKTIPGTDPKGYGNVSYYGWRTAEFDRKPSETFPNYNDILKGAEERKAFHPLQVYSLEINDGIKNEYAAAKAIYDQTRPILNLGFSDDPEKTLNEYLAKMKAAGYDKILEEGKKQAKNFITNYDK